MFQNLKFFILKIIFKHIKLLLISLLLIGFAYILDKGIGFGNFKPIVNSFNINTIRQIYAQKEAEIEAIINKIGETDTASTFNILYTNEINVQQNGKQQNIASTEELDKQGFVLLIYKNDSLAYWSSNAVAVEKEFPVDFAQLKIIELSNSWFTVHYKQQNNLKIVGLVLIIKNYPHESDLLKSHFQADFELPESFQITTFPVTGVEGVYSKTGDFLFGPYQAFASITDKPFYYLSMLLYVTGFIIFFFFLRVLIKILNKRHIVFRLSAVVFFGFIIFIIRYLIFHYKFPNGIYIHEIFGPQFYAHSDFLPSLGDIIIHVFVAGLFFLFVLKPFRLKPKEIKFITRTKFVSFIVGFIVTEGLLMLLLFINNIVKSFIYDSNISLKLYQVLNLDINSLFIFLMIFIIYTLFLYSLLRFVRLLKILLKPQHLAAVSTFAIIIFCLALHFFDISFEFYAILFIAILIAITAFIHYKSYKTGFHIYIAYIFILSLYISGFLLEKMTLKEKDVRKLLVKNLVSEHDPLAEHFLINLDIQIQQDQELRREMIEPYYDNMKLIDRYLENKYFNGFWDKYSLQTTICGEDARIENDLATCIKYHENLINEIGEKLPESRFYYLNNDNGSVSYVGSYDYTSWRDSLKTNLIIVLNSNIITERLGYPELLQTKNTASKNIHKGYAYAKYSNYELVNKYGNYNYNLNSKFYNFGDDEFIFVKFDGFDHLVYNISAGKLIILSKESLKLLDILSFFSYIFVFQIAVFCIYFITCKISTFSKLRTNFNIENKLQLAFISVLLLSFLVVGGGSVYYYIEKFKEKHYNSIEEKLRSVTIALEQKLAYTAKISSTWKQGDYTIEDLLKEYSAMYYSDINLYNTKGHLIASSRPEIFEQKLIGNQLNAKAYKEMIYNSKPLYIHQEEINGVEYISAYGVFSNIENEKLAYINLPFFTKPNQLREELSALIVTLINLYVLLLIFTLSIAVLIANKITLPLRFIQNEFRHIELGKKDQHIEYKSKDEIGSLVREHNRMVVELRKNADLLAKSERESAWRDMAKQVAHEIKNPLTPMKLSVQHLERTWKNKDANFDSRLQGTIKTLLEQINTLSNIASEFSDYAKMPEPVNKEMNLIQLLNNVETLFKNEDKVKVILLPHDFEKITIIADNQLLSRVFVNLVKNAMQSIPENREGLVQISVSTNNNNAIIEIKDNGMGISTEVLNKLFVPNFTTKDYGSGLGLPISKKIIEDLLGTIWFETKINQGSSFYVKIPIYVATFA